MPKRTNPFQQLSASIMATLRAEDYDIEESVIEVNPKTGLPREIDIRITERKVPANKTLVECRDRKRKQDVIWIDELDGKARSLGIKKVIAVSSSGFTDTAVKEAASRGIQTLHLWEAEEKDWKIWLFNIKEFGINIDFEPKVKKVNLVSPDSLIPPSLSSIDKKDIFLINTNTKTKISLTDYIQGIVKDPKIINFVQANNVDEATTQYDYEIPCDKGVGYLLPNGLFVPLIKVIFSLSSIRRSYKIPMRHVRVGESKMLVGEDIILGNESRVVLEEKKGELTVMIESKVMESGKRSM